MIFEYERNDIQFKADIDIPKDCNKVKIKEVKENGFPIFSIAIYHNIETIAIPKNKTNKTM